MQEYDSEIRPLNIVRGQGLCKLVVGSSNSSPKDILGEKNEVQVVCLINSDSQYADLTFYLTRGYAPIEL